jgi:NTP pyrophosphatase (non-canonical NTP hydrolase)
MNGDRKWGTPATESSNPAERKRRMVIASTEFSPRTIADYAARAAETDQRSDGGSLRFPLFGLFGETGSLLSEVKKKQRDRASYLGYAGAVVEELGDVLWYLSTVAARADPPSADCCNADHAEAVGRSRSVLSPDCLQ